MSILVLNRERRADLSYADLLGIERIRGSHILSEHSGFEDEFGSVQMFDSFRSNCLVEKRGYELIDRGGIDAVIATSEYDLVRAARLREYGNLAGQDVTSARAFRDKVVMKDLARKRVDVPAAYARLQSARDVHEFVEAYGFPIVLKPVDGAGSLNTTVIESTEQLASALNGIDVLGYELETFVEGRMYVVDGLVFEGQLVLWWASRYMDDCLSFREGRAASLVQLDAADPLNNRLHAFCIALLAALPTPSTTTFHLEVFHTTDDRIVLCEVASRTGGGAINELAKQRFGVNMHAVWISAQSGRYETSAVPEVRDSGEIYGFAQIPPKPGRCARPPVRLPFDFVVDYRIEPGADEIAPPVCESSEKIATVVVKGNSGEVVADRLRLASEWMAQECFR